MAGLSYAFDPSAGETPQSIAQRRQLADAIAARIFGSAPKNVGEGLNAIGQALIARTMRDETDAAQKAGQATIPAWLGGTGAAATASAAVPSVATPPAVSAAPMGNIPAPTNTTTKIYSNDEPSPLDPPSGDDRNAMIATVLGEAGNQGPAGMNAVASVIRNRAVNGGFGGNTPLQVVTAKNQFEPWNTPQGRANMAAAMQNPQQVAAANTAIESAYAGNDPTNGATMFYSPSAQAALGRPTPSWAQGPGQDIGDHRFFGGAPQPPTQVAQAAQDDGDSAALPPAAQSTQGALPTAQAAQAASQAKSYGGPFPTVSTADLTRQAFNPWIPQTTRQVLTAEITRRAQADQQANDPLRQLQIQKAQQDLDKSDWEWKPLGRDANGNWSYGFINSKTHEVRDANNQPVLQQQKPAEDPTQGLTGEDYLKALPTDRANIARKVANGEIDVSSLPYRGNYRAQALADAARFDPTFSPVDYKTRLATRKDFTSGKSAQNITSFNTAIGHLDTLDKAIDPLGNSSSSLYNRVTAPVAEQFEPQYQVALKNFRTAKQAVADELSRAFKGAGGTVHDISEWEKTINAADSPAALHAAVKQAVELLHSRISAIGDQYNRGMGKTVDPVSLLSPKAQATLSRLESQSAPEHPQSPRKTSSGVTWSVE